MRSDIKKLMILFISALTIRLLLINTGTLMIDMGSWVGWSDILVKGGLKNFYLGWSDYLPSYLYVLWLIGKIKIVLIDLGFNITNNILYKMPAILSDLGTAGIIYFLAKKYINKKTALWAFALYAFNPAIFANSAMWGQVDGVEAFLLILTLWLFLKNKFYQGSAVLAYAALLKPIGLFIAPIALIILLDPKPADLKNKILALFSNNFKKIKEIFTGLAIFSGVVLFLFFPLIPSQYDKGVLNFAKDRYEATINQYKYTSINAFNFWAISGGMWKSDLQKFNDISLINWGLIMFLSVSAVSVYFLFKNWSDGQSDNFYNISLVLAIIFFSTFSLLTRAHERHLLLALPFLSILSIYNRKYLIAYIAASSVYLLNLYFSFTWVTQSFKEIFDKNTIFLLSGINIAILFFLLNQILKIDRIFKVKKTKIL